MRTRKYFRVHVSVHQERKRRRAIQPQNPCLDWFPNHLVKGLAKNTQVLLRSVLVHQEPILQKSCHDVSNRLVQRLAREHASTFAFCLASARIRSHKYLCVSVSICNARLLALPTRATLLNPSYQHVRARQDMCQP